MTRDSSDAGLADPYWYEWSIGQSYLIEMLDERSGIASVTLQQKGAKGLDDVVVRYASGAARFIQVKHTRVEDTLTFGDLVATAEDGSSLLGSIAAAWATESASAPHGCDAWLVTNRAAGQRPGSTTGATPIDRPPLDQFLPHLASKVSGASTLAEIEMPSEWVRAWKEEWLARLDLLGSDTECLKFLRAFRVNTSEDGLAAVEERLAHRLRTLFAVDSDTARALLGRLDSALRTWATSLRGTAQAIVREAVYAKLCLVLDRQVGEHGLAPPAPFFASRVPACDDLCRDLTSRSAPIVFVTGSPGSGKTAVISHLANRRDPVIDARFHAYRPITPENQLLPADAGRTTTSRALWSDLLIQIRAGLGGRLSSLDVPIHAGSLSEDALRGHVLRLADAIGTEQERPFVVAIDGIDHAARSGTPTASFLESLVGPDAVPSHVVFLVGGQPPDAYADYPAWLRAPTTGVQRIDLPGVPFDDTLALLRARIPQLPAVEQENAARDIWDRCQGNTLSTVFAVEEASLLAHDLGTLPSRLDRRQLATGVEAYYRVIWDAAVHAADIAHLKATRLAAALCLLPVRATGAMVRDALGVEAGSVTEMNDLLRQLRPLIIEEDGGFRVFHNDVRVFLLRVLRAEPAVYEDCAGRIADHLMRGENVAARHAAAQDLYGVAGRRRDQATLFTPAYVLDGHVVGRSLDVLTEQAFVAADSLTAIDGNWDLAHSVATGLRTIHQLRASLGWTNADLASNGMPAIVATRGVERRVLPRSEWTSTAVATAVADLSGLCAAGERRRAEAAFRRWFEDLSPGDIARTLGLNQTDDSVRTDRDAIRTAITEIGRLSASLRVDLPRSGDSDGGASHDAEACFATGVLQEAETCVDPREFLALRGIITRFYVRDAQKLVTALVERRAWLLCKLFLLSIQPRDSHSWSFRLQVAACASVLGGRGLRATFVAPVLGARATMIAEAIASDRGIDDAHGQLATMAWTAFLLGLEEPLRDSSAIREEIERPYRATTRDDRHDAGVAQILHAAALAGSLAAATRRKQALAPHVDPSLVARTIDVLMSALRGKHHFLPLGFPVVAAAIVRCLAECAEHHEAIHRSVVDVMTQRTDSQEEPGIFLETVWRSISSSGTRDRLIAYADAWVGPDGRAWTATPAERHEIVGRMAALLDEIGEVDRGRTARERLPWGDIGYTGHKEVAIGDPFAWFDALRGASPAAWEEEGVRLLAISREASRSGDNEYGLEVDEAVLTAACTCGPDAFRRLTTGSDPLVDPDDRAILSGLLACAEQGSPEPPPLLAIWALATGHLCWQVDRDRARLAAVRERISASALRIGAASIPALMAAAAPAEFASERAKGDDDAGVSNGPDEPSDLPVVEAMRGVAEVGAWRGIARVLRRIDAGTAGGADAVTIAWQALRVRPARVWWYDGAGPAFEAIFPMLSPAQRWGLLLAAVKGTSADDAAYRLATLTELLDGLCRLSAASTSADAVRFGLQRLLDMHELWLSGNGRLGNTVALPLPPGSSHSLGWGHTLVDHLVQLVAVDAQTYVQAALRGLHQLIGIDAGLYPHLIESIDKAPLVVQRRFLFTVDALAHQDGAGALRTWLAVQIRSTRLDVALAAWGALRFAALARGEPEPEWPIATDEPGLVQRVARPLMTRPSARTGIHVSVGRASTAVLDHLGAACGEVDDLRSELAASVRDDPPTVREARTRTPHDGDMVANHASEAELDRLFTIMRSRERQGRFSTIPLVQLAQMAVPFADPFVFLKTPQAMSVTSKWAVDDKLDALFNSGVMALEATLASAAEDDLAPSLRLIAVELRTFSRERDVVVRVDHVVPFGIDHHHDERPSVLNGRCSLLSGGDPLVERGGARDQEWLTRDVAGLMAFVDGTLDFFPGRCWRARLGWLPRTNDPLTWHRDGRTVAWFERLRGPVRRIYAGDYLYRQPTLGRWVCVADEWSRIEAELGVPQRRLRSDLRRTRMR